MATVITPLQRARLVGGARTAVVCSGRTFLFDELLSRVTALAAALRALGLQRGDRVAVVGPNCHRYLELYQAAPGAGLVLVPLNQRHSAAELRYALRDSGARVLFTGRDPAEFAGELEHVVDLGAGYEQLLAAAPPDAGPDVFPEDLSADELAGLFYTGGTTGAAKGVMLTHRNLVANALHFQVCWPFTPDTRWLVLAPLFHAAGSLAVLATTWNAGSQVVLPSFEAARALDLIETQRVTATLAVPTMLAALSDEQLVRPRDVTSLRYLSHGGSPIASETARRARLAFPGADLLHIYGATETAPIATLLPHEQDVLADPADQRVHSCGQPAVGVEIRIAAAEDPARALPPGAVGEVLIRGENVMAGYWQRPVETAAAFVGRWYRSGDLGYQDGAGYLYLVDRTKDMIVSGGENVYSTQVEEVLYAHPAVLEAAVFAVPDTTWGEAVHAVVVLRPGERSSAEELLAHCRSAMAGYQVPKRLEVRLEPLPKSGAGKILKRELRAPFWAGQRAHVAGA